MATSILAGISQEATQEELLGAAVYYLAAMLEKMPRLDSSDKVMVQPSEGSTVVTSITAGTISTLQNIGGIARDISAVPFHLGNAGAMHIYNNLVFGA